MSQCVVAVRMDDARDFVVDPVALQTAPSVSEEFPVGCRVRVTDVAKCFPKADTMAETLFLGKWTSGTKPHEGSVAMVLSSAPHPTTEDCIVIGIRSEIDSRDFVIDAKGLTKAPHVSKEFPEKANVRIKLADKAYIKMDAAAKELTLSKWTPDTKPQDGELAVVLGSMAHPSEADAEVIGIRTAKGQDFVIAPEGLELVSNASEKYPVGARVYITSVDKLYPKMEDVAKTLGLSRWVSGAKPIIPQVPAAPTGEANSDESAPKKRKLNRALMTCAGEVRGSTHHPDGEIIIVGVRTETGQEFLVAEDGLQLIPNEHADFPFGTRVKIADTGKVYPKWDDKAFQLALTRWVSAEKPSAVVTGKVMGSVAK